MAVNVLILYNHLKAKTVFSKCCVIFLYIVIHGPLNVKFECQKSYVTYFICSENVNSSEICQ